MALNKWCYDLLMKWFSELDSFTSMAHCYSHSFSLLTLFPLLCLCLLLCFSSLHYSFLQNVNPTVAQDWVSGLQRLILKKEEEIRAADRCRIQLQLPGKQDKFVLFLHFQLQASMSRSSSPPQEFMFILGLPLSPFTLLSPSPPLISGCISSLFG